jgi:hypothetical protein
MAKTSPPSAPLGLDFIHIANALEMRATRFLSFDIRQRHAASAEGLIMLP